MLIARPDRPPLRDSLDEEQLRGLTELLLDGSRPLRLRHARSKGDRSGRRGEYVP
jgi:hypothetical protein